MIHISSKLIDILTHLFCPSLPTI